MHTTLLDFDAGWIVKTSTIHKVSPDGKEPA